MGRCSRGARSLTASLTAIILVTSMVGCFGGSTSKQTYTVSGRITRADNPQLGIQGVMLAFSGGFGTSTTASDGRWSKSGLSGTVTVTPILSGWTFAPASRQVGGPATNVDFTGSPGAPTETRDVPYIPKAITGQPVPALAELYRESGWGAWEVVPQISTNYNRWVENLNRWVLPELAQLTPDAQYFSIDGEQFHVNYGNSDDPRYDIKITLTYDDGRVKAVYMKKADNSSFTYIVKHQNFYVDEPEIRQLVFENLGSAVHAQALYYRKLVDDMNDIVEIWEESDTKKIKCFRVYNLSQPERIRLASAFVDNLLSGNNKTTGRLFLGSRDSSLDVDEIPESPAIFNDDELLVQEHVWTPPEGYPSPDEVLEVYNTGITLEVVAGAHIDPDRLESNL